MYTPSSTYRIQFNKNYTFKNLLDHISYLSNLGVGAIYASPIFAAVPESNHGYDVTDSMVYNPEIGTSDEFKKISDILKSKKIGWIQDIVPNHMAFHPNNPWLMDVMEKGKLSAYAYHFDIDWEHPDFKGKIMVPVLGKNLNQAIADKEIKLCWKSGGFYIEYYDFRLPVSGESFHELLEEFKEMEGSFFVGQGSANTDYRADPAFKGFGWSNNRQRLQAIYDTENSFETLIENICDQINSDNSQLEELLKKQHYTLAHWQDVENHLNYRRFFTINGLICLKMENRQVFEDYHRLIEENIYNRKFQGLRIDHTDGLKNPNMYFERLRAKMGEETFIVVEKILEHHEELEKDWPIQGSSGYDFLALINNIFTNHSNYPALLNLYNDLTHTSLEPDEVIYQNKKMILTQSFRGDWDNICRLIDHAQFDIYNEDITPASIREAVGEFLINCPVYKLYSNKLPLSPEDEKTVHEIISKSIYKTPHLTSSLKALQNILLGNISKQPEKKAAALEIFLKCMQYTGPLMAKGVEDTTMYTWNAFIAHNEVGDAVNADGILVEDFHKRMIDRRNHYRMSINATATHDTKRGEDSRARLNVISDLASEWESLVKLGLKVNTDFRVLIGENMAPDVNEEYFIYQTLLGALPVNPGIDEKLLTRLDNYFQKALREAKIHSSWNNPNEEYEKAVCSFARNILTSEHPFRSEFLYFFKKLNRWGIVNSLSQVVLKCTCPGIPDFYQGTELWDFSLVDPDNRGSVNYPQRTTLLNELKASEQESKKDFFKSLYEKKDDGRLKLWISHKLMLERASSPQLFIDADYLPLDVEGDYRENLLAYARCTKSTWYIAVIPLHLAALPRSKKYNTADWGNSSIVIPENAPKQWINVWDEKKVNVGSKVKVSEILEYDCPIVLKGVSPLTGRGSGTLMHITSLPGKYGTGDLGEEAYKFVDFLKETGQSYWQILPFNPTSGYYSPYSSYSAFAGNTLLIDPDFLRRKNLLEYLPETINDSSSADFEKALEIREEIIELAFNHYIAEDSPLLQKRYETFCRNESYWLDDFALYCILKNQFDGKPWNEWPDEYKTRDAESISKYKEKFAAEIARIKFGQFLFSWQFGNLKTYANSRGVKIIGDMPIYVSYDSSDVWANPHLFLLDKKMNMTSVAGVPPDYFSETGQLWNMPIYNWELMRNDGYRWWIARIRKNLDYCDMLRFDHFRGFASYWEVPAGETTAINGRWITGPDSHFFDKLKTEFPGMPFIAEDLGDIDEKVYKLRDNFSLPGMRVLQFAFGDNMPLSVHIPHLHTKNSIVYTGTHDNNTLKGWYNKELSKQLKKQIRNYFNKKVDSSNISEEFTRAAYSSVADIVVIPMQDLLNLDETARFNTPSVAGGNWEWKLKPGDIKAHHKEFIKNLNYLYAR